MNSLIDRIRAGETLGDIAKCMGVSRQRVHQIASKLEGYAEASARAIQLRRDLARAKAASEKVRIADAKYLIRYGMTKSEYLRLREIGAVAAYRGQKGNAATRRIGWEFSLVDWWAAWDASGMWGKRGVGMGYVMARKNDAGPYSPGNIYICTQVQNVKDSYVFKPAHTRRRPGVARADASRYTHVNL